MKLFNFHKSDILDGLSPSLINGSADHLLLAVKNRTILKEMDYDLNAGQALMLEYGLVTRAMVEFG